MYAPGYQPEHTEMPTPAPNESLADDLLHGAKAIGDFLGIDERAARWSIDSGGIPVKRMGRKIIGSKSVLRRRFIGDDQTA